MTTPQSPATATHDEAVIQLAHGLAEVPGIGQRVAVMITVLLPKDAAVTTGEAIVKLAEQLSSTRLVVAGPNGVAGAVGQQPG